MSNQNDNFDDDFESVSGSNKTWNPTVDKDGDPKSEASKDDFIIGFYKAVKHGIGQHNSTVHTLELKDGSKMDIWGSKMLNEELEKVREGDLIKITWLGKHLTKAGAEKPEKKRTSTDSFHKWDVAVSTKHKNTTPVADTRPSTQLVSNAAAPATTPAIAPPVADESDDLPF
jgi:hypothetical protein